MANFRGGYLEQGQPLGQNIGTVSLTSFIIKRNLKWLILEVDI